MAKEISEIAAYPNRSVKSKIEDQGSKIAPWLRSFPTTRLKRRQSGNDSRKVSMLDWEAAPPSQARRLRFCTNIRAGASRSIISIFFAWKIDNRSRGLA